MLYWIPHTILLVSQTRKSSPSCCVVQDREDDWLNHSYLLKLSKIRNQEFKKWLLDFMNTFYHALKQRVNDSQCSTCESSKSNRTVFQFLEQNKPKPGFEYE
jgi:hypothetical protein